MTALALNWEELICGKVDLQKSRAEDSPAIMYTRTCAPFQQKKLAMPRGAVLMPLTSSFIAVISSLDIFSIVVFTPHFFNSISLSLITNWKKYVYLSCYLGKQQNWFIKYTLCVHVYAMPTHYFYTALHTVRIFGYRGQKIQYYLLLYY